MNTLGHAALGLLLFILYPLIGDNVFIAFFASLFIDFDHMYILIKYKISSFKKIKFIINNIQETYKKYPAEAFKDVVHICHTIEFNIILATLAVFFPVLWYVLLGFVFHIWCDFVYDKSRGVHVLRLHLFSEFIRLNRGQR